MEHPFREYTPATSWWKESLTHLSSQQTTLPKVPSPSVHCISSTEINQINERYIRNNVLGTHPGLAFLSRDRLWSFQVTTDHPTRPNLLPKCYMCIKKTYIWVIRNTLALGYGDIWCWLTHFLSFSLSLPHSRIDLSYYWFSTMHWKLKNIPSLLLDTTRLCTRTRVKPARGQLESPNSRQRDLAYRMTTVAVIISASNRINGFHP